MRTITANEAALSPAHRTVGIVRYLRRPKRSWAGWTLFVGFIILNEMRGTYMVAQVLAQTLKILAHNG